MITSATQESLHVSKGLLGPGHCVVVDNEKGSQGLAGEAGRNVVLGRERREGDSQGVGASSLPHPLPPTNPVVAGWGREGAGSQVEEAGIEDEVHPSHPHEARPIGWSLGEKVKIFQPVVRISKKRFHQPSIVINVVFSSPRSPPHTPTMG